MEAVPNGGGEGGKELGNRFAGGFLIFNGRKAKRVCDSTSVVDKTGNGETISGEGLVMDPNRAGDYRRKPPSRREPLSGIGMIQTIGFAFQVTQAAAMRGGVVQKLQITSGIERDQPQTANIVQDAGGVGFAPILAGPIGDFR